MASFVALVCLLTAAVASAANDDERGRQESAWQAYFAELAAELEVSVNAAGGADDQRRRLELHEKPLLRWSQPVRGGDDGAVYLWLDEGRPAAVCSIFAWPHTNGRHVVVHEFHSLSQTGLSTQFRGEEVWRPGKAGVDFQPFPDARPPAANSRLRLTQMRALARRFSGLNIDDQVKPRVEWKLRLLPQPLYRIPQDQKQDGARKEGEPLKESALFALVQGTDPEVLLLIEARPHKKSFRWEYALARFSDRPLTVRLDEKEVWSVERTPARAVDAYYVRDVESRLPPTSEDVDSRK